MRVLFNIAHLQSCWLFNFVAFATTFATTSVTEDKITPNALHTVTPDTSGKPYVYINEMDTNPLAGSLMSMKLQFGHVPPLSVMIASIRSGPKTKAKVYGRQSRAFLGSAERGTIDMGLRIPEEINTTLAYFVLVFIAPEAAPVFSSRICSIVSQQLEVSPPAPIEVSPRCMSITESGIEGSAGDSIPVIIQYTGAPPDSIAVISLRSLFSSSSEPAVYGGLQTATLGPARNDSVVILFHVPEDLNTTLMYRILGYIAPRSSATFSSSTCVTETRPLSFKPYNPVPSALQISEWTTLHTFGIVVAIIIIIAAVLLGVKRRFMSTHAIVATTTEFANASYYSTLQQTPLYATTNGALSPSFRSKKKGNYHLLPDLSNENNFDAVSAVRCVKRNCVDLVSVIGTGSFGNVWKAVLDESIDGGAPGYIVAAKVARNLTYSDKKDEVDLLVEAAAMSHLPSHPNIVSVVGIVSPIDGPAMLLLTYCDEGSLLAKLNQNPPPNALSIWIKFTVGQDVARGMEHLSAHGLVHRDLSARNVLVSTASRPKFLVADFGLARYSSEHTSSTSCGDFPDRVYHSNASSEFPIRWTAPEAIASRVFSVASDVWSFGVLMIEVFENGMVPYDAVPTKRIYEYVTKGNRLSQPPDCPLDTYDLISRCWSIDPVSRPNFSEISKQFAKWTSATMVLKTSAETIEICRSTSGYMCPSSSIVEK